jgi:hypothetical protein
MKKLLILLISLLSLSCEINDDIEPKKNQYEIFVGNGYIASIIVQYGTFRFSQLNYTGGGEDWQNNFGIYKSSYTNKFDTIAPNVQIAVTAVDGGALKDSRVYMSIKKNGVVVKDTTFNKGMQVERITIAGQF